MKNENASSGNRNRTVVVEVCSANNLMPKDGQGSASAYVEVDFDSQRKKTRVICRELSPVWNETLRFPVSDPSILDEEDIEVNIYNDKTLSRGNFLGRVRIPCKSLVKEGDETLIGYALDKRSLFSNIKGEIYLKAYYTFDDSSHGGKKNNANNNNNNNNSNSSAARDGSKGSSNGVLEEKQHNNGLGDEGMAKKGVVNSTQIISYAQQQGSEMKKVQQQVPQGGYHHYPQQHHNYNPGSAMAMGKGSNQNNYSNYSHHNNSMNAHDFSLKETHPRLAATAKRSSMLHGERSSAYGLVERMEYLYVKIVKAKGLLSKDITGGSDPYVQIKVGNLTAKTKVIDKSLNPEWNQVFAFGKEKFQAPLLELTVKDKDSIKDDFLGYVSFEISEVPARVPPDSPLAPQWYKLEGKKGGNSNMGEIMVSVWRGTQADEAFPEAWQSDSGGHPLAKSKVYLSPRLWYLRVNVIEAQDLLLPGDKSRLPDVRLKAQLGFQVAITRSSTSRSSNPFWNEDLLFVAAEPFEDPLILSIEDRVGPNKDQTLGKIHIPIATVESSFFCYDANSNNMICYGVIWSDSDLADGGKPILWF